MRNAVLKVAGIVLLGFVFAAGLGFAAHLVTRDTVGLSGQPLATPKPLAPPEARQVAPVTTARRPQRARTTTTATGRTVTTAPTTTTRTETEARTETDDDESGRGRGRGRGRSGGDDDNSGSGGGKQRPRRRRRLARLAPVEPLLEHAPELLAAEPELVARPARRQGRRRGRWRRRRPHRRLHEPHLTVAVAVRARVRVGFGQRPLVPAPAEEAHGGRLPRPAPACEAAYRSTARSGAS